MPHSYTSQKEEMEEVIPFQAPEGPYKPGWSEGEDHGVSQRPMWRRARSVSPLLQEIRREVGRAIG